MLYSCHSGTRLQYEYALAHICVSLRPVACISPDLILLAAASPLLGVHQICTVPPRQNPRAQFEQVPYDTLPKASATDHAYLACDWRHYFCVWPEASRLTALKVGAQPPCLISVEVSGQRPVQPETRAPRSTVPPYCTLRSNFCVQAHRVTSGHATLRRQSSACIKCESNQAASGQIHGQMARCAVRLLVPLQLLLRLLAENANLDLRLLCSDVTPPACLNFPTPYSAVSTAY